MIKLLRLVLFLLIPFAGASGQGNILQSFNAQKGDITLSKSIADNSNFIIAGYELINNNRNDGIVLKIDASGAVLFQANITGAGDDVLYGIIKTNDGGYLATGYTTSSGAGKKDALILRLDANLAILWQRTFGAPDDDAFFSALETSSGDIYVWGYTNAILPTLADGTVLKLNSSGQLIWTNRSQGLASAITDLIDTEDGYIVCGGYMADNGNDFFFKRINANTGVAYYETLLGSSMADGVYDLLKTSDNKLFALGNTRSTGSASAVIIELNPTTGRPLSNFSVSGPGDLVAYTMTENGNDNLYLAGYATNFGWGGTDIALINVSKTGSVFTSQSIGGNNDDNIFQFSNPILQSDGKVFLAANSKSYSSFQDGLFVNVDPDTNLVCCGIKMVNSSITPLIFSPDTSDNTSTNSPLITSASSLSIVTTNHRVNVRCPSLPKADFSYSQNNCSPNFEFTDKSSGSATIWSWNFGDPSSGSNNTAVISNPSHRFSAPGTYTVKLVITSTCENRSDSISKEIIVGPTPILLSRDTSICPGDTVTLRADRANSYSWTPTGSLSNPDSASTKAYPTSTTTYHLKAVSSTCTLDTNVTIGIAVAIKPIAQFTYTNPACGTTKVQFKNNSSNTFSWDWDFGDPASGSSNSSTAQHPAHSYSGPGNFTVRLVALSGNGCFENDTLFTSIPVVKVNPPQLLSTDTTICTNDTITLRAIAANTYQWSPPLGLSDPTSATTKAYPSITTTYRLYASNISCVLDTSITIRVTNGTKPIAQFSNSYVACGSPTIHFNDQSIGGPLAYNWSFGDPGSGLQNTTNQANPSHTYRAKGIYPVRLIVTDTSGCGQKDTVENSLTVNAKPTLFSQDTAICQGDTVQLLAGFGDVYAWTPITGLDNPVSANPRAYPNTTTTYRLISTTLLSTLQLCRLDTTITITVIPYTAVIAGFTLSDSCEQKSISFQDKSAGNPTYWSWNFGDPSSGSRNTSTLQNPTHTFLNDGNYKVKLVAKGVGCSIPDSIERIVTIHKRPQLLSKDTSICRGDTILLSARDGDSYLWSPAVSLDNPTGASTPAHPTVTSTYRLRASTLYLCSLDTTLNVTVMPSTFLKAAFLASNYCTDDSTIFTDKSTGPITDWEWKLQDVAPIHAKNIKHLFPLAGHYTVKLIVRGVGSCIKADSVSRTIAIGDPPKVLTNRDTGMCKGDSILLKAINGTSYTWSPSAGLNDIHRADPTAKPDTTTTYIFQGSNAYCSRIDSVGIVVVNVTKPDFSTQYNCIGDSTRFIDQSSSIPIKWIWTFGDSNDVDTSYLANPRHLYTQTGTYRVKLVVSNYCGSDSLTKSVTIDTPPEHLPLTDTTICKGDTLYLHAKVPGIYQWSPGVEIEQANTANPVIYPSIDRQYTYTISSLYCSIIDSILVRIGGRRTKALFSADGSCQRDPVSFNNLSEGDVLTRNWDFGDPASGSFNNSSVESPKHTYSSGGIFKVTLRLSNSCSFSQKDTFLHISSVGSGLLSRDTVICFGDSLLLSAIDSNTSIGYSWTPIAELSNPAAYQTLARPKTTTRYYLTTVNGSCSNLDSVLVIVKKYAPAVFDYSQDACVSTASFTFDTLNYPGTTTWWLLGDGTIKRDNIFSYQYAENGVYTVRLITNPNTSCEEDSTREIIYTDKGYFVPNVFSPNQDGQFDELAITSITPICTPTRIRIFDRWGQKLFEGDPRVVSWNGLFQGQVMANGVYVYLLDTPSGVKTGYFLLRQ